MKTFPSSTDARRIDHPTEAPPMSTVCTAAALYLMSQYARQPCPLIAHAVADQLRRLAMPAPSAPHGVIRRLAASLLPLWRNVACGTAVAVRH